MNKSTKSISLVELMISIMIVSTMVLSFCSLENYSHKQVLSADRRTKVQNSLAYCLEHMSKYVQQANGDKNNPPIKLYSVSGSAPWTGFQVRFDCGAPSTLLIPHPQTPSDLTDDVWVYYTLSGNTLSVGCTGLNCGNCSVDHPVPPVSPGEVLSDKFAANFSNTILPASPPDNVGFYVVLDSLPGNLVGSFVDVGLVGRFYPTVVPTLTTKLTNPQIAIKTKLICSNSSTN
ncbi:MAG: hypothetical protein Q8N80_05405 [Candidatus Omnitrophota bacterium]|nr:hypothetical protein [Candidatus Omnitrophota bacterium]